jgi:hypothetical protein
MKKRIVWIIAGFIAVAALLALYLVVIRPEMVRSRNLREAEAMFNSIDVGMEAASAGSIAGFKPGAAIKYMWTRDFGRSEPEGAKECFELEICVLRGKVVRVKLRWPCGEVTGMQGMEILIREKGITGSDWEKAGR